MGYCDGQGVGDVIGLGGGLQTQQFGNHELDLFLFGATGPGNGLFDLWR